MSHYPIKDPLPCPYERTLALANTPTRLARIEPETQERIINWGYAVCDAAFREYIDSRAGRPKDFVYPEAWV